MLEARTDPNQLHPYQAANEERTALAAELRAFHLACAEAGLEPSYVLLRNKRAFTKGWQQLRPSLDEALTHIGRAADNSVGIQPFSLGCVVLDCDEGEGPPAAESWAGEAHVVTTPSSSGCANRGHVWVRCDNAEAVGNWKFQAEDPLGDVALGELRTKGGQVRLRAEALARLRRAIKDGRLSDGPARPLHDFLSIRASGRAVDTEAVELDWEAGADVGIEDLPEKLREKVQGEVPKGDRSEAVASILWSIIASGASPASAFAILSEHWVDSLSKRIGVVIKQI